jgi:IclR family pca regulon transcriptional regulator
MSDPEFVNSLARGLDVLGCFERGHQRMTLSQVAERTSLTRGTARRFLLTLCTLELVATDGKLFWLTPKVLRFSSAYLSTFGLGDAAYSIIKRVTEQVGESSSMAVLDGAEIVYVARVEVRRVYSSRIEVGTRLPAHSTSMGIMLLAGLSEADFEHWLRNADLHRYTDNTVTNKELYRSKIAAVRQRQYAINDSELEVGVRSISVPILDNSGQSIAALNVVSAAARTSLEHMESVFVPILREAASDISRILDTSRGRTQSAT